MKLFTFIIVFILIYQSSAQEIEEVNPNTYRFSYKSELYKGTKLQITKKIRTLKNNSWFVNIPEEKQVELNMLFKKVREQPIPRLYKKRAIIFLDALYAYEDFLTIYDNALYAVILHLKRDMRRLDFKFERQFTKAKVALDRANKEDKDNIKEINRLSKEFHDSQIKLMSHRWMKKKIERYRGMDAVKNPDELIAEFKKAEAMNIFTMIEEKKIDKINSYLENQIIDFFYKKSLPEIHLDKLELDYIDKI
ncbi:hypothetical protein [Aquimarina algiphila]|uniref:hypothetical protein n=1 Tax=Aquimarina algiphila TaxID=2047982 RepID=UPI002491E6D1|nr:hypothetical protein [Aquimarina algiphila]